MQKQLVIGGAAVVAVAAAVLLYYFAPLIMDTVGFPPGCSTVLLPGTGNQSPFAPFRGVAPVVLFGF